MVGLPSSASSFVEGVGENTKGMLQLVPFLFDNSEQSSGSTQNSDEMAPQRAKLSQPGLSQGMSLKANNTMDCLLDTRNQALCCAIDGVLKIGGIGAAHAATLEAYSWMRKSTGAPSGANNRSIPHTPINMPAERCNMCGLWDDAEPPTTRREIEKIVYKAGKEGLQWGMVAGMYAGLEYGMEKARGKHDWKNAAVGGALTGIIISMSDGKISQDKTVRTALTASALATAADFLKSVHLV